MSQTIQLHDLVFKPFLDAGIIQNKVTELGVNLTRQFKNKTPIFIAILNGSFIFAADLVRACNMNHEISFVKLMSYEGTSTSGKVVTQIGLKENIEGREVIIIEDIIDTGTTLASFLPTLKKLKPKSISIVSLLLKPTALKHSLPMTHIGFEIPNKFVVGYGLDYNGLGRNLKGIYQLKK